MNLIKNNPCHFLNDFSSFIEHTSQNFSSHDNTRCWFILSHISCHQSNIFEFFLKLSKLLVWKSLYWRGVNDSLIFLQSKSYSILSNSSLTSRCMCSNKNRLLPLNALHSLLLKCVKSKLVLLWHWCVLVIRVSSESLGSNIFMCTVSFLSSEHIKILWIISWRCFEIL